MSILELEIRYRMITTKTTIYLLNNEDNDSILFIIDALSEYILNHPDKIDFAKRLTAQIMHCKENFTEVYSK